MKAIYKYPLVSEVEQQQIHLRKGSEILSVMEQRGDIVLYARVDPASSLPEQRVTVWIYTTGSALYCPGEARFLGTVSLRGGGLVYHVFVEEPTLP